MKKVVIVSATRTAIGHFNGSIASVDAIELGKIVIEDALKRIELDTSFVDEVIIGNVIQSGLGQNPARQSALKANLSNNIPAFTINKVCGSGLKAITLATQSILAGDNHIMIAGGMENMSQAPYLINNKCRWNLNQGKNQLYDTLVNDGLYCSINHYHMGMTAEILAKMYDISRSDQDQFALRSHQLAQKAISNGEFIDEIVPITVKTGKEKYIFQQDQLPKFNLSLDHLSDLIPIFKKGTVTTGNISNLSDGAAALIIMSENRAKQLGLRPLAYIRSYASGAVNPNLMGLGSVSATKLALKKASLNLSDIDLIEAGETFAAQFLALCYELDFDLSKTNIRGGTIALGHPIGSSGARILVTLLYTMIHHDKQFGLATLGIGGGLGISIILERC
ncbi:thiolase family protein [Frischella perrara]|uniref:Acetyl-CoA C-acetyltransferase n=1 Tax=Frischella perrara TaxID=1267021 RepID=A0A318MSH5_FRIPE|nr:acetyl-CoA C-acyltransferase [Frischella perrara]PXY95929.1 acetyl-CoA C-acetyltransferase [Frischella perrara]